jgi:hypothetical protein
MKMCVQEEWRLVMELGESAMLVTWDNMFFFLYSI